MIHRDINNVFVSHTVIVLLYFSNLVCSGEHVWLLFAHTAVARAAASYSSQPQHFHSKWKVRAKLPGLASNQIFTAFTDTRRLKCSGQQHCFQDRKL